MTLLILILLILTNYVIVADMPENSKMAYYITLAVISIIFILNMVF